MDRLAGQKSQVVRDLEAIKAALRKNLEQMDLENVSVYDEMEDVVDGMCRSIDAAIARVNSA